jgi:hypothetical protein
MAFSSWHLGSVWLFLSSSDDGIPDGALFGRVW